MYSLQLYAAVCWVRRRSAVSAPLAPENPAAGCWMLDAGGWRECWASAYLVEYLWIVLKMKEAFRVFLEDRGITESKYLAGFLDAQVALVTAFEKSVEGSSWSHIECIWSLISFHYNSIIHEFTLCIETFDIILIMSLCLLMPLIISPIIHQRILRCIMRKISYHWMMSVFCVYINKTCFIIKLTCSWSF